MAMKSLIKILFLCLATLFIISVFFISYEDIMEITQNGDIVSTKEEITDGKIPEKAQIETEEVSEQMQTIEEKTETITEISDEIIVKQPILSQIEDNPPSKIIAEEAPQTSFSTINTTTRETLVNIFCTTKSGGTFKPITGSGVIIDERGIILTNAHIAQYFLLKNYITEDFIDCVIRADSPAKPLYTAMPIFISPSWVKKNASVITQQSPKGTGEDDYALLLITQRTDPTKTIPETFSFISPLYNSGDIEAGEQVLLVAYPAGFLSGIAIAKDLYISSAITQIMEVFTFGGGTLDLFSIGGSVVAQQGSSGGAVVSAESKLLGIIVTSSVADTTAERDLRAITIAHINRSFVKDTGFDLQTLFSGNIEAETNAFNENIAPALTQLLIDELEK